ncbi:hypothetical protein KKC94_02240 [Patescibacteria group bacterium]|nr:hypothetical protein [Patescibacteria group bacterium]
MEKYPKLSTLALSVALACNPTIENLRIQANEAIAATASPEYKVEGPKRTLTLRGQNLSELHKDAYKAFIAHIEEEIRNPKNSFTLSEFSVNARKENDTYVFEYSVNLNPTAPGQTPHRVIDTRGTVWTGPDRIEKAKAENAKKVPSWQERMKTNYQDVHFEITSNDSGSIFVEEVMAKAK